MHDMESLQHPQALKEKNLASAPENILIIGAGFSGTVTAIRLLQNAKRPIDVILMEKIEEQVFGGLAYSSSTAGWEHLLNMEAGRITAFSEKPDDFIEWANNDSDRASWPTHLQDMQFGKYSSVPRRLYQQYLRDRLNQTVNHAFPGVSFSLIKGEAIDLVEDKNEVNITYVDDAVAKIIHVGQVIIAIGNIEHAQPSFIEKMKDVSNFIVDQYSQKGREAIESLRNDQTVFIIGTGLTAFDAVITLLDKGHTGKIILSSRHGYTHFSYPQDYERKSLRVRRSPILEEKDLTVEKVVAGMTEEFHFLLEVLKRERPDIQPQVYTERILKAWEPYIAEIIERLSPEELRTAFNTYRSLFITSRTGTISAIGNRITERMKPEDNKLPQVVTISGNIQSITNSLQDDGTFTIDIIESGKEEHTIVQADSVILGVGQESDYAKVNNSLWSSLIDRKDAIPHRKIGHGIEIDIHGQIVNDKGQSSARIYTVGPMRQGDEMQRRGKIGANIGEIRKQALQVAMQILNERET